MPTTAAQPYLPPEVGDTCSRPRRAASRAAARAPCRPRSGGRTRRRGHRHHAHRDAVARQLGCACIASWTSEPVATITACACPAHRPFGQHVAAPVDVGQLVLGAEGQILAPEEQRDGPVALTAIAACPGHRRLGRIGRPPDIEPGNQPQAGACSTDWCVGPSSPRPIDVVGEHMDHALLHQRRHADRVAAVVAESQEGAAKRNEAAVQRHAVHDRGHAELAHAVVDVAPALAVDRYHAAVVGEAQRRRARRVRQVRTGQVGAPPSNSGSVRVKTSSASWLALRVATVSALAVRVDRRVDHGTASNPAGRSPVQRRTSSTASSGWAVRVNSNASFQRVSAAGRLRRASHSSVRRLGHHERLGTPAQRRACQRRLRRRPAARRAPWRCRRDWASPCRWSSGR